jgi:hypothetical protein
MSLELAIFLICSAFGLGLMVGGFVGMSVSQLR